MKRILIFLAISIQAAFLQATGLEADVIYINGEEWCLFANPLFSDSIVYNTIEKHLPQNRIESTANRKGFITYWSIVNNTLYLEKVEAYIWDKQNKNALTIAYPIDSLKKFLPPSYIDGTKIPARWVTEKIRAGRGKGVRYVHSAFDRNVETECVMEVHKGKIIDTKLYQNYKKEGYSFENIKKEVEQKYPFNEYFKPEEKNVKFISSKLQIAPDGHFLDCYTILRGHSKENIIDQEHPAIKALKECFKELYPWEVFYIHNEYRNSDFVSIIQVRHKLYAQAKSNSLEIGDAVCYLNARNDTIIPFGKYTYMGSDTIDKIGFVVKDEIVCIDNTGQELFTVFPYDNGPDYIVEGYFRIIDKSGKIGFANREGDIRIQPQYAFAHPFSKGKTKATYSGKKVYIDDSKEHWVWDSDEWFTINKRGEIIEQE